MTTEDTSTEVKDDGTQAGTDTGTDTGSDTGTDANAEATQRSVHELLKLTTYQGMTDAEIKSLIDYHVEQAHQDETVRLAQQTEIQTMNAQCAAYDALLDDANSVLKQVLAAPLNLATIDSNGEVAAS